MTNHLLLHLLISEAQGNSELASARVSRAAVGTSIAASPERHPAPSGEVHLHPSVPRMHDMGLKGSSSTSSFSCSSYPIGR